jgi:lipopolysaccharide cholinephosphotransferase
MDINRQLQLAQLDLLLELKRICEKNNINYFLIAGSLIGAVRHQGFIPWDDDIDVAMLRDDYERFAQVCPKELDSAYSLIDWNIDKSSPLGFMKLKIKNTKLIEAISCDSNCNKEIFLDIFPYDEAPAKKSQQIRQNIKIVMLKKILLLRCDYRLSEEHRGFKKIFNKTLYKLLQLLFLPFKTDKIREMFDKETLKYKGKNTGYCINYSSDYKYQNEIKDISYFDEYVKLNFEGYEIPACKEYHKYLTEIYGDYMQLPPESQRVPRHNIGIDLNGYKIRNKNVK